VDEGQLHEERQLLVSGVEPFLERVQALVHRANGRQHESRFRDRRVGPADEVLPFAELAGPILTAAFTFMRTP
jgi:hypothetical protein